MKLHISGIGDETQWGGLDFNAVRKIERSPNGLSAFGINVPNPIREGLKVECAEGNAGQQGAEFHGPSVAGTRQKARFGVTVFDKIREEIPQLGRVRVWANPGGIMDVEFLLGDNCQLVDVELFSVDPQVGFGVAASAHCDSHVIFAILSTDRPRSHVRGDFLVRLENGFQQAFTCDSVANPGQVRPTRVPRSLI